MRAVIALPQALDGLTVASSEHVTAQVTIRQWFGVKRLHVVACDRWQPPLRCRSVKLPRVNGRQIDRRVTYRQVAKPTVATSREGEVPPGCVHLYVATLAPAFRQCPQAQDVNARTGW